MNIPILWMFAMFLIACKGKNDGDHIVELIGKQHGEGEEGPAFTSSPPPSVHVYFGHCHDFTCTASGIPPPKISWTFHTALGISPFPSGSYLNQDHTTITVKNIRNFGFVTCIAENAYGRITTSTSIYIKTAGLIG